MPHVSTFIMTQCFNRSTKRYLNEGMIKKSEASKILTIKNQVQNALDCGDQNRQKKEKL